MSKPKFDNSLIRSSYIKSFKEKVILVTRYTGYTFSMKRSFIQRHKFIASVTDNNIKCSHFYQNMMKYMTFLMQCQLIFSYHSIFWCPCNTRHTRMLHGHQIVTCLVITVTGSPYFNKLLRFQAISHERCKNSYKFPIYSGMIMAFKCESHVTGHHIWWNHRLSHKTDVGTPINPRPP